LEKIQGAWKEDIQNIPKMKLIEFKDTRMNLVFENLTTIVSPFKFSFKLVEFLDDCM
jgi:hypothetical protein